MAASHEVISCWTGRNARWKPQAHTKVVGLFGNAGALFARCLLAQPGLLWREKTQYGGFIWDILSYQDVFHLVCTALGQQRQEIQLLPVCPAHLPDNPGSFQEIPAFLSNAIPGATGWLVNQGCMSHRLHFTCCTCVFCAPLCSPLCFIAGGSSAF